MPTDRAPHNMTSNVLPTPFVASESSVALAAYSAFDGTDNYAETYVWPSWIQIDLGAGYTIGSYALKAGPVAARAPKAWTLLGSNDPTFATSTLLATVTNQTAWATGEVRTFACDTITGPFEYYRWVFTENNGDATYLLVREFYLYDAPTSSRRRRLLAGGAS